MKDGNQVSGNQILAMLSPQDRALLDPHLEAVDLPLRKGLASAGRRITHAYFLDTGMASLVTNVGHKPPIEIGVIGHEGFVNLALVMAADRASYDVFMQMPGRGQRIAVEPFLDVIAQSPALFETLRRFAHVFMAQNASTILANARGSVSERLARWLLMASDRCDGEHLALTHEFLSDMLGVRRSGVSTALQNFSRHGLVNGSRGQIRILDHVGLRILAKGYYGTAEAEWLQHFGDPSSRIDL